MVDVAGRKKEKKLGYNENESKISKMIEKKRMEMKELTI